jgi:hypothetical protein
MSGSVSPLPLNVCMVWKGTNLPFIITITTTVTINLSIQLRIILENMFHVMSVCLSRHFFVTISCDFWLASSPLRQTRTLTASNGRDMALIDMNNETFGSSPPPPPAPTISLLKILLIGEKSWERYGNRKHFLCFLRQLDFSIVRH